MLQQDYLMRLIMQFVDGIKRSMDNEKRNPKEAADSLEDALSRALDMDASVILGLAPESFASVAQISIADPRIAVYIVYTMALEAHYLREAECHDTAQLRYEQACAFAAACGVAAPGPDDIPCDADFDALLAEDGIEA
ncbi:MAG: hypothetical protein Q4D92_01415 [Slackia sp.]|nr:hypothetical protein [Slackia sp.]